MVTKTFYTKDGEYVRVLSSAEVAEWAARGDNECKKAILSGKVDKATTLDGLKAAIKEWLQ